MWRVNETKFFFYFKMKSKVNVVRETCQYLKHAKQSMQ